MDYVGKGQTRRTLHRHKSNKQNSYLKISYRTYLNTYKSRQLPTIGNRAEDVDKFIHKSLAALRLEYLDLYLIHAPIGLVGKHDMDLFPLDENGFVVLDMQTDLIKLWKVE